MPWNNWRRNSNRASDAFLPKYEAGELQGKEYDEWANQVKAHRDLTEQLQKPAGERWKRSTPPHRLAFIQCVGSRDIRFNRHCSGFCCMHAIKEAIIAREHDTEAEVLMFGMDIRAVGKGFEEYRNRGGREAGIQYIRSRVAEITRGRRSSIPSSGTKTPRSARSTHLPVDLVILATACEPSKGARQLAEIAGVELNEFGFFKTDPFTAAGYDTAWRFCLRLCPGPMDIPESVAQSSSAAARAAQILSGSETERLAS